LDIFELKKAIKDLPEREVRSCLYHILLGLNMVREKECSNEEFINDLNELYYEIMISKDSTTDLPNQRQYEIYHTSRLLI
jgi:hypothetical protein